MEDTIIPFEPTASFCYQFSRYQALPEILESVRSAGESPFRLLEFSKAILDKYLTLEQQGATVPRAQSAGIYTVGGKIKYYIPFIAKNTGMLISMGNGLFRLPVAADLDAVQLDDAALEQAQADGGFDETEDFDGSIYAFSFPLLMKQSGSFPIKIGKTGGDVEQRVEYQCKGSASFENPKILGQWRVKRVGSVERAIHLVLRARGKWRENVPGTEWFDTTIDEVESIISFIQAETL